MTRGSCSLREELEKQVWAKCQFPVPWRHMEQGRGLQGWGMRRQGALPTGYGDDLGGLGFSCNGETGTRG